MKQCTKKRAMKSVTRGLFIKTVLCFMGCIMLLASPVLGGVCFTGDIDDDCQVNINDLRLMALQWLDSGPIPANLDGQGNVDYGDFAILSGDWREITTLTVTISPQGAINAGAQWRVDGGAWQASEDISGLLADDHLVEYDVATGYDEPTSEMIPIAAGQEVELARTYIQQTGTLIVNISPQGAIDAGAQWRVDGGEWRDSGSEVALVVGIHTVEFSSVSGWQKPGSVQVEIFNGTQAVVNRSYLPIQSVILHINEFMADNDSRSPLGPGNILDGDLMSSDWIEIYNNSGSPVDISEKYLTDESNQKTKWQFPSGMSVLQPGDYLIVFASGKTQELNPGNYPYWDGSYHHTNFELDKDGEYLGLTDTDGTTTIHEYNYPDQEKIFRMVFIVAIHVTSQRQHQAQPTRVHLWDLLKNPT